MPYIHRETHTMSALADPLGLALYSVNRTLFSQSDAILNMRRQYENDEYSRAQLKKAIEIMHDTLQYRNGKIVVSGIGKSFKIANKLVATLNSLLMHSTALHPLEALHGDLGVVNELRDCIIFMTASGNTPELINLLPHILAEVPIILLTCTKVSKLAQSARIKAVMYAELPLSLNENAIHGLPAPTVLATLLLVLADAAVLALLEMIERDLSARKRQFLLKHPGGSIGADLAHLNTNSVANDASCTSLLSLNQIRNTMDNVGSLTSSDDELDMIKVKSPQKVRLQPSLLLSLTSEDLGALFAAKDELKLLTWITVYNFIVLAGEETKTVSTAKIRDLYNKHLTGEPNWNAFLEHLIAEFS